MAENFANRGSGGLNVTFDEGILIGFWKKNRFQHSIVVQGGVRFDNTSFHNLTFETNYKMEAYLEDQLLVSKHNLMIQTRNTTIDVVKGKIYKLEIRLWID